MPSSGVLTLGFPLTPPSPPRIQYIGNPDQEDTLIIENRYAGPVALQWADSDIQIGSGLIGQPIGSNFHVPALSRVTYPWPREFGANVQYMNQQIGNVLFNNVNTNLNVVDFHASSFRYWWMDAHANRVQVDPIFPEQNRILVSRFTNLGQGGQVADIVIGGGNILTVSGFNALSHLTDVNGDTSALPANHSPEGRIMRLWVTIAAGGAQLSDLEMTPFYEIGGQGNSFYPFGSTALGTTEHQAAGPFPCPGAIGCMVDLNGAGAGTQLTVRRLYEIGVPFD